jgi:hypothetical protein
MRAFVITTFALAVALAPAVAHAQDTTTAAPKPPTVAFTTTAGILLVQIKQDKNAAFEEMIAKLKTGLGKVSDEGLKKQAAGLKFYKGAEPFNGNTLYVVLIDPAVAASEYDLFQMLNKTMTPEEQRAPETAEMWKRFQEAFAAGLSKLSLTQVGG